MPRRTFIGLAIVVMIVLPTIVASALSPTVGTLTAQGNVSKAVIAESVQAEIYSSTAFALLVDYSYFEDPDSNRKDRWIFSFETEFPSRPTADREQFSQIDDPEWGNVDQGVGNLKNSWIGTAFPLGTTTGQMVDELVHQSRSWPCPWCSYSLVSSASDAGTITVTVLATPTPGTGGPPPAKIMVAGDAS